MPKLLYTWYFEKFTASVTNSGHSALRHEVSRMCTILIYIMGQTMYLSGLSSRAVIQIIEYGREHDGRKLSDNNNEIRHGSSAC